MNPLLNTILAFIILVVFVQSKPLEYSQGAWNIQYLPTDSINTKYLGKEVRLDFKRNSADTISGNIKSLSVRKLLSRSDTVTLEIKNDSVRFVEHWKIYPDHGVVSEQYLQGIGTGSKDSWIKELYLRTITRNYITVEAYIYSESSQEKREILIPKSSVKGVLIASGK